MGKCGQFESVLGQLRILNAVDAENQQVHPDFSMLCNVALGDESGQGPLNRVIVQGDHVAVAVMHAIPSIEVVVQELAGRIASITGVSGADAESPSTVFVFAPGTIAPGKIGWLTENHPDIRFAIHDPGNEADQPLLAIGCEANPLAINRDLFDADVVLVLTSQDGHDGEVESCGLYPALGSEAGQLHFEKQKSGKRSEDCRTVERCLGANFVIAVTAGPGGIPDGVFAGIGNAVHEAVRTRVRESWTTNAERDFDLIVVTIESPSGLGEWDGFRAALRIACQHAGEHAPIVVICDIDHPPPDHVAHDFGLAMNDDDHASSVATRDVRESVGQRPVYLASGLDQQTVEDLGFGYLENSSELGRLIKRLPNCGLIRDAHKCFSLTGSGSVGGQEPRPARR